MAAIIGIGITRFAPQLDRTIVSLAIEAGRAAIMDAELRPADIGCGFFANALGGRLFGDSTIGQVAFAGLGCERIAVVNVENACTSGSSAFYLARMAVDSGEADIALVLGSEKMCVPGLGLIDSGLSDVATQVGLVAPASFALRAHRYQHEFGATAEQFAAVTCKSRGHAALNPLALFRDPLTPAQVLASPMVASPLTRSQCCPIADGAAAVVLACDRIARGRHRAVKVRAAVLASGAGEQKPELAHWETDRLTAQRAYERAGLGPQDIDVTECHDAFSIAEILHSEALGFFEIGSGARMAAEGRTRLGGSHPINVSGGLLSRGHPVAATGVAQLHELTLQLRHEAGARQVPGCLTGLAQCMGGDLAGDTKSCTVVILNT